MFTVLTNQIPPTIPKNKSANKHVWRQFVIENSLIGTKNQGHFTTKSPPGLEDDCKFKVRPCNIKQALAGQTKLLGGTCTLRAAEGPGCRSAWYFLFGLERLSSFSSALSWHLPTESSSRGMQIRAKHAAQTIIRPMVPAIETKECVLQEIFFVIFFG